MARTKKHKGPQFDIGPIVKLMGAKATVAQLVEVFGFYTIVETLLTSKKIRPLLTPEQLDTLRELIQARDDPLPIP